MNTISTRGTEALLAVMAVAVAAYAFLAYALLPAGVHVGEPMQEVYRLNPIVIHTHAFAAGLALLLGPWQFSSRLRARRPQLHRWVGRIYLVAGIVVGGVSGLLLSRLAQGGWVAQLGFACLAIAWLYTGYRGYRAIRRGERAQHRRWMLRNHALTLAAVSLRLYIPLFLASGVPFELAYPVIAWICWVPHLLIAQWWLGRKPQVATGALPTMPR
ncbi:DUF2306 domain-containing protein [Piscinibacter sp. HJYY11]|uniref:DUF2306 domain-containing protein n=1 Tax=Piscinibacter sp. HJYY11 TaxID=2801333 RepID=UPI00191FF0A5|nr:DUF2306 domain-containing protein [Piscinibacter sp. HJYY11]MBL0729787.1 DUF2306 domain-containing protein [Piscinibacter sp. HJYY11]